MANDCICLKCVKDILGMNFFIPDYQRGYRWEKQQARDLLEDIYNFSQKNELDSEEIYCIQPLVVRKREEDILSKLKEVKSLEEAERLMKGSWNVVDGQQRLTTIRLILTYFNYQNKYNIAYQTREKSSEYLDNPTQSEQMDNIDYYHIYEVYNEIRNWFSEKSNDEKNRFKSTLLNKVNFIWYEISGEDSLLHDDISNEKFDEIAVFTRLNIGKIPLTDSELIKALFLNRSNYEDENDADVVSSQRKIAIEWDEIEYTLQNDEFWLFIHGKDYDKPTRIDFILDLICQRDDFKLYVPEKKYKDRHQRKEKNNKLRNAIGEDEHKTFRYFYEGFKDGFSNYQAIVNTNGKYWLDAIWQEIKKYFQIFNEWYHDYKLYHYVGYLITIKSADVLYGRNNDGLLNDWFNNSKDNFVNKLKERIFNTINISGFSDLDGYRYDEPNQDSKSKCVPILLLHNIETVIQQNERLVSDKRYNLPNFTKFPFHLYKSESWQVEHIRPNSGDATDDNEIKQICLMLAKDYQLKTDTLVAIDNYLEDNKKGSFEEIIESINHETGSIKEDDKNKIWNFALLDEKTNKEYQNFIFPIKRTFVANKEKGYKIKYEIKNSRLNIKERTEEIAFVPICTKNVFSKFYSAHPSGMLSWSQSDARDYLNDIKEKLAWYLDKVKE